VSDDGAGDGYIICARWNEEHTADAVMDNCVRCQIGIWISGAGRDAMERLGSRAVCVECSEGLVGGLRSDPTLEAASIEYMGRETYEKGLDAARRFYGRRRWLN
jgi:hypothetical protein